MVRADVLVRLSVPVPVARGACLVSSPSDALQREQLGEQPILLSVD